MKRSCFLYSNAIYLGSLTNKSVQIYKSRKMCHLIKISLSSFLVILKHFYWNLLSEVSTVKLFSDNSIWTYPYLLKFELFKSSPIRINGSAIILHLHFLIVLAASSVTFIIILFSLINLKIIKIKDFFYEPVFDVSFVNSGNLMTV